LQTEISYFYGKGYSFPILVEKLFGLERELMNEGDNPLIGIVLCADKSGSVVKYTLPENETQIFASKYKFYLPSEEELLREVQREHEALEYDKKKEN